MVQSLYGVHTNTQHDNLKWIPFSLCQNRMSYTVHVLQAWRTS